MKKTFLQFLLLSITCISYAQYGSVNNYTKIHMLQSGFPTNISTTNLGRCATSIGDLNNDGVKDLAIGEGHGVLYITFLKSDGTVLNMVNIEADTYGLPSHATYDMENFARAVDTIGDLNSDGVIDLVVGMPHITGTKGHVFVLFMNSNGSVSSFVQIGPNMGGLNEGLTGTHFGMSVAGIGDINNDGILDIAVGGTSDNGGKGRVWFIMLNASGTVKGTHFMSPNSNHVDDYADLSLNENIRFGSGLAFMGDMDGNGTGDLAVTSYNYTTESSKGSCMIAFLNPFGIVSSVKAVHPGVPNYNDTLINPNDTIPPYTSSLYGISAANLGDINGDGFSDLVISAPRYSTSDCSTCGAVDIVMLDSLANVVEYQQISDTLGNFSGNLEYMDEFGRALTGLGDVNGDLMTDLLVGAPGDDEGGNYAGAVYILHLNGVWDPSLKSNEIGPGEVRIYPNPVHEILNIRLSAPAKTSVHWELLCINGTCLRKGFIESGAILETINTRDLIQGLYMIRLTDKKISYTRKVIISGNPKF
jgi:hypothetical protein